MKTPTPWPPLAALACATLMALAPAQADTLIGLDVTATPSWGLRGDASNTVVWLDIGAGALVNYLGWDVQIESHYSDDPWPATIYSWMDELGLAFTNSTQTAGFALRPGWQTDGPGSSHFDGAGLLADLSPRVALPDGPGWFQAPVANLYDERPDFNVGADGLLRIEFYELREKNFAANLPDGRWVSGSLTFDVTAAPVPEPQGYALLGAGLLALGFLRVRSRRNE